MEQLIQVCYDMGSPKAHKREVDALVECAGELGCDRLTIVTHREADTIVQGGHTVRVVPFLSWQRAEVSLARATAVGASHALGD